VPGFTDILHYPEGAHGQLPVLRDNQVHEGAILWETHEKIQSSALRQEMAALHQSHYWD
jgi:hypothetical protein